MLVLAYIPCGSEGEAQKIGKALVKEKLAACANIIQSSSIYEWEGDMKNEGEWIVLAKTIPKKFAEIKKRVTKMHSYDLPCIIGLPVVDVNEPYQEWVREQVK